MSNTDENDTPDRPTSPQVDKPAPSALPATDTHITSVLELLREHYALGRCRPEGRANNMAEVRPNVYLQTSRQRVRRR